MSAVLDRTPIWPQLKPLVAHGLKILQGHFDVGSPLVLGVPALPEPRFLASETRELVQHAEFKTEATPGGLIAVTAKWSFGKPSVRWPK